MQVEFPVQCACGLESRAYEIPLFRGVVVECECGTRLKIDSEDWLYMSQVQMAREMKRCDWNGSGNGM